MHSWLTRLEVVQGVMGGVEQKFKCKPLVTTRCTQREAVRQGSSKKASLPPTSRSVLGFGGRSTIAGGMVAIGFGRSFVTAPASGVAFLMICSPTFGVVLPVVFGIVLFRFPWKGCMTGKLRGLSLRDLRGGRCCGWSVSCGG